MSKHLIKYSSIAIGGLAIILVFVYFSQKHNEYRTDRQQTDNHPKLTFNEDEVTLIKTLRTQDGTLLGDITVTGLHSAPPDPSSGRKLDDTFTALYIVKKVDGKDIILYKINRDGFFNTRGKEMEFAQQSFYGYQFARIYEDHFIVHGLANNGKTISDDVTIEWNSAKALFEIQRSHVE